MKCLARMILAALLAVGLAVPVALAEGKTHQAKVEFVSWDADAGTVTVKNADGRTMILKVEGKAAEAAKGLKAGEAITLTCRDDDQGLHEAVVSIEKTAKASEEKR